MEWVDDALGKSFLTVATLYNPLHPRECSVSVHAGTLQDEVAPLELTTCLDLWVERAVSAVEAA